MLLAEDQGEHAAGVEIREEEGTALVFPWPTGVDREESSSEHVPSAVRFPYRCRTLRGAVATAVVGAV